MRLRSERRIREAIRKAVLLDGGTEADVGAEMRRIERDAAKRLEEWYATPRSR